jgi:hypothetical protein
MSFSRICAGGVRGLKVGPGIDGEGLGVGAWGALDGGLRSHVTAEIFELSLSTARYSDEGVDLLVRVFCRLRDGTSQGEHARGMETSEHGMRRRRDGTPSAQRRDGRTETEPEQRQLQAGIGWRQYRQGWRCIVWPGERRSVVGWTGGERKPRQSRGHGSTVTRRLQLASGR